MSIVYETQILTAEIDALQAEIEEVEEYDRLWSQGARKARLARLQKEQLDLAHRETERKAALQAEALRLNDLLVEQTTHAVDLGLDFVAARDEYRQTAAAYDTAWRAAAAVGVAPVKLSDLATLANGPDRAQWKPIVQVLRTVGGL